MNSYTLLIADLSDGSSSYIKTNRTGKSKCLSVNSFQNLERTVSSPDK